MYEIIIKAVESIPDSGRKQSLKTEMMSYFFEYVLSDKISFCNKFRKKHELYEIADDIIRLRSKVGEKDFNDYIETFSYSSSTVKEKIKEYNSEYNSIRSYVLGKDSENYIEAAFHLKAAEKRIKTDKRRYAVSLIIPVLSIIGGIIGAIIGAAFGEEGLKQAIYFFIES
ncbi:MAG: hypothetical protein LBP64_02725 [Tannerella sp.]|jgi:hypothetical protein|nr:hypothetical protein [Tannerella sp.]